MVAIPQQFLSVSPEELYARMSALSHTPLAWDGITLEYVNSRAIGTVFPVGTVYYEKEWDGHWSYPAPREVC